MSGITDLPILDAARELLERHEWRAAFDALSAADGRGELDAVGLELLAQAAWWSGRLDVSLEARERAYSQAVKAKDDMTAVVAAIGLARDNLLRMNTSVATAWLNRVERHLESVPENPGHGWLAGIRAFLYALSGDNDASLAQASTAHEIAIRIGDRDLEIFAIGAKASALIARGDVEQGLALADEATVAATSGEIQPLVAGGVCCTTIEACAAIGDLRRAAEWTAAQDRWCRREGINGYPGMCRLFRSEVKTLRGAWPEAEAEARTASDELRGYIPAATGLALYQIGEIRLRLGDLPAAEEALLGAHSFGADTEPALSLLRLAQGKTDAAVESIRLALSEPHRRPSWRAPPDSELYRLRLLPAQVEISLAAGDVATARGAADALGILAERFGTQAARASAQTAFGAVELAEGDAQAAAQRMRGAVADWLEMDAPYDAARTRLILAEAYVARDARDNAAVELRTARDVFERLGAAHDLRRTEERLRQVAGDPEQALGTTATRTTRAFVFTDIVDSTRLAEALGDEAWGGLKRWHDRALRSAAAEQGGEEVKGTGDGFFMTFADADNAIEAAIAMQRRLAAQREAQGFAPEVRIGIHLAEADRIGLDYAGTGVNQAARIGDAAAGGEILVSAPTLAAARHRFTQGERRTLELRGVSARVEVVSISWS